MVNNRDRLSLTFAALADPTRRRILERLSRGGESRVVDLSEPFSISAPAITKHLRALERAHLIQRQRRGREHYISASLSRVDEALRWMRICTEGWIFSLDRLDGLIEADREKERRG